MKIVLTIWVPLSLLALVRPVCAQLANSENFSLQYGFQGTASGDLASENFSMVVSVGETTSTGAMSSETFTLTMGLMDAEVDISIDVMPADADNTINTKRRGNTPVAIFSSLEFDASQDIDLSSLTFGRSGDEFSLAFCPNDAEDVNEDGVPDQVCFFDTQLTGLEVGDTEAVLRGVTSDGGTRLIGIDAIIVPR